MDKKNSIIGILCITAGIIFMFWQQKELAEQRALDPIPQEEIDRANSVAPDDAAMGAPVSLSGFNSESNEVIDLLAQPAEAAGETSVAKEVVEEQTFILSNDFIEVEFTSLGGAIKTVSFLQTKRGERDDYVFNTRGLLPALSLSLSGNDGGIHEFGLPYQVEFQSELEVTFVFKRDDGFVIRRSYFLSADFEEQDPYIIRHRTVFLNPGNTPQAMPTVFFNLGTATPISENQQPDYLNVGYFDGEGADFVAINKLTGSGGFLGFGSSLPVDEIEVPVLAQWSSVKNQFFAAVLSSSDERVGKDLLIYPVASEQMIDGVLVRPGITASVGYDVGILSPSSEEILDFDFFVGPKEFKRLQALGNHQDEVMEFGFLSFISKLLLSFMYAIHAVIPSWGWSIIVMTICIKLFFWPLSAKASRSQKRMAKIQGPMAELKEKHKDNPQKMQQETLKLFKEYQVNPVAGCLPMLIQMPIFLGLFYMLRTASELRHEPFLWVSDLSQPDTLMHIAGLPLNILPLIMALTMFFQMRMMPVSPTADPMQQKVFKFLPFVMLVFLYNFSSGLVLYWTVQNVLTIIQQKIINSQPDEELKPIAAAPVVKGKGGFPRTKKKR